MPVLYNPMSGVTRPLPAGRDPDDLTRAWEKKLFALKAHGGYIEAEPLVDTKSGAVLYISTEAGSQNGAGVRLALDGLRREPAHVKDHAFMMPADWDALPESEKARLMDRLVPPAPAVAPAPTSRK